MPGVNRAWHKSELKNPQLQDKSESKQQWHTDMSVSKHPQEYSDKSEVIVQNVSGQTQVLWPCYLLEKISNYTREIHFVRAFELISKVPWFLVGSPTSWSKMCVNFSVRFSLAHFDVQNLQGALQCKEPVWISRLNTFLSSSWPSYSHPQVCILNNWIITTSVRLKIASVLRMSSGRGSCVS